MGGLDAAEPEAGWLPEVTRRLVSGQLPPPQLSHRSRHATRRRVGLATGAAAAMGLGLLLVPPSPAPVSFQQEVRQHLVLINEPTADQSSFVVEAPHP